MIQQFVELARLGEVLLKKTPLAPCAHLRQQRFERRLHVAHECKIDRSAPADVLRVSIDLHFLYTIRRQEFREGDCAVAVENGPLRGERVPGEALFSSCKISESLTHRFAVPPLPQAGEGCCQLIFRPQDQNVQTPGLGIPSLRSGQDLPTLGRETLPPEKV
jgi:hypothetical protein